MVNSCTNISLKTNLQCRNCFESAAITCKRKYYTILKLNCMNKKNNGGFIMNYAFIQTEINDLFERIKKQKINY